MTEDKDLAQAVAARKAREAEVAAWEQADQADHNAAVQARLARQAEVDW